MATSDGKRAKRGHRFSPRLMAVVATASVVLAASACGAGDSRNYDIAPIFPLTSNKCSKYDGKVEGSGFTAHCWVTKAECERAAQDWRQAMRQGGVTDAIEFSCD
jgi:hypothetical protein